MLRRRFLSLGLVLPAATWAACRSSTNSGSAPPSGSTAGKPTTFAEIAAYSGSDRQQMLEDGAKAEANVSWYTTIAGDVLDAQIKAFNQKYPYVKVDLFRADTNPLQTRLQQEAQAKKYVCDVTETGDAQALVLRDELKVLLPFFTPLTKGRPPASVNQASGNLNWWLLDSESYVGFAYNTTQIPDSAVPKTWQDIVNPALKGKMGISGTSTGATWAGNLIEHQGEAFLAQVAKQDIRVQQISAKALLDLVASGEVAASPAIYRDHAEQASEKGAPVKWIPLEPVTTGPYAVSVINNLPHPHAGMLLADHLISEDGAKVMETFHYGSSGNDAGFQRWYQSQGMTAAQYDAKFTHWQDLFTKEFIEKS